MVTIRLIRVETHVHVAWSYVLLCYSKTNNDDNIEIDIILTSK